jgi:hypothetical protein
MQSLDLKARIKDTIRNRPSATRGEVRARVSASLLAGYGASLVLFVAVGAVRVGPRPLVMVAGAALGTALVAIGASWAAIGRGDEMSGRSPRVLAWTAAITPLAVLGWRLSWDAQFAPIDWHTLGLRCFALMTVFAGGPLAALGFLRRGVDPVHPRLLGAALGVAAGAYGSVLVDLWCPSSEPGHLLLGHIAPFGVLALVGAWLGARAVAPR